MTTLAPLELHHETVQPEWIDYNGHMNVAYYVLAFDHATDAFLDYLGLDEAHRRETAGSTFAVESNISYLQELSEGDPIQFTTQLLAYDAKRIHLFHQMYQAHQNYLAATSEWLLLYVDLQTRRVAEIPPATAARLAAVMEAHAALPWPKQVGRIIKVPDKPAS